MIIIMMENVELAENVKIKKIIEILSLEIIYAPKNIDEIEVKSPDANRPGLVLTGFVEHFDSDRIQIIGQVEHTYLSKCSAEVRQISFERLFGMGIPAFVITRDLPVFEEAIIAAKKYQVPILRTCTATSSFLAALIGNLHVLLAPCVSRHGVFVEVYGEGILLLGVSGVGKSETAMELVKRGHRLIADDAVEIRRVSDRTLVGTSPENIRYFIELRGIGVVDVRQIFGMGSVKETEKVDLVINMELWLEGKAYERLGIDDLYTEMLGIKVPSLTIPVKPGRNLAIIIEVAAMNNRQKKMGYNAAQILTQRLMNGTSGI